MARQYTTYGDAGVPIGVDETTVFKYTVSVIGVDENSGVPVPLLPGNSGNSNSPSNRNDGPHGNDNGRGGKGDKPSNNRDMVFGDSFFLPAYLQPTFFPDGFFPFSGSSAPAAAHVFLWANV